MINCQFRIIQLMPSGRYIGVAWNYDRACLVSTRDFECYSLARLSLEAAVKEVGARLKWFDGLHRVKDIGILERLVKIASAPQHRASISANDRIGVRFMLDAIGIGVEHGALFNAPSHFGKLKRLGSVR